MSPLDSNNNDNTIKKYDLQFHFSGFLNPSFETRYESILVNGYQLVTNIEALTFICYHNEIGYFERMYTSTHRWTVGNIVSHIFRLLDEFTEYHNLESTFIDQSLEGFDFDMTKNEIEISLGS